MSHNIFEKMFYSLRQPAWHALREPSMVEMPAVDILNTIFLGGFPIDLRPITLTLNGEQVETGHFGIVRGSCEYKPEEEVFGYCTERYHPLQPRDVAETFDLNVGVPVETLAFLGKGEELFITWKMDTVDAADGNPLDFYGVVRGGFDTTKGWRLFTSIVRPVCWNTITLAQGWAKNNSDGHLRGELWKGKATSENLLEHLGYWMSHVQETSKAESDAIRNFFANLSSTPINSDAEVEEILLEAYPDKWDVSERFPAQLRAQKSEKIAQYNEGQASIRKGIMALWQGLGTAITRDAYGVLNCTTEFFGHYQPSKRPVAESIMFGGRQRNSMAVVDVLTARLSGK